MDEVILKDWRMFTDLIESTVKNYPNVTANYIQFRGQSNSDWKLTPSLTRIVLGDSISESKAEYYETQARMEFLSSVHLIDSKLSYNDKSNHILIYVDMQHYSCPTRLLDWSESPYVALYFAVNECFETSGAFYIWDYRFYNKNISAVHEASSEVTSSNILEFRKFDFLEMIFPMKKNDRIVRKQGAFSISNNLLKNHDEIIQEVALKSKNQSGLYKIIIPKELKHEFLSRLKTMNITAENLFPGLDGLGRSIKESLVLRKATRN